MEYQVAACAFTINELYFLLKAFGKVLSFLLYL